MPVAQAQVERLDAPLEPETTQVAQVPEAAVTGGDSSAPPPAYVYINGDMYVYVGGSYVRVDGGRAPGGATQPPRDGDISRGAPDDNAPGAGNNDEQPNRLGSSSAGNGKSNVPVAAWLTPLAILASLLGIGAFVRQTQPQGRLILYFNPGLA